MKEGGEIRQGDLGLLIKPTGSSYLEREHWWQGGGTTRCKVLVFGERDGDIYTLSNNAFLWYIKSNVQT
ncbi:hypothetical protein CKAN_00598000 [Cinnamomum micranthum f. kanehirae]|uniref:Uncharacterized protein n=1 Tax=Cinnamomum micranthum f. kanehirae TaxID=337451 RepID=A0A3S3MYU5_9MAGN|nr:hypothetical protein CKAN_00598000 [Cinnamomum micranthum f. kanehirae]